MPEPWQQWYPRVIDAWCGSVHVQSLSDSAYRAYDYLLMAQWQSEDGKLPVANTELAKMSRTFGRWSEVRDEVLGMFVVDGDRMYNRRMKEIWDRGYIGEGASKIRFKNSRRTPRIFRPELSSPAWRRTRLHVLKRDGYVCKYCGDPAGTVDHVHPVARGGVHSTDNLVAACKSCNSRKGRKTLAQAGMAIRGDS